MKRIHLGLLLLFIITACSIQQEEPFSSLANRGILPLSTSNPYLGSNLFIAHEAELSPVLFNFLQRKGAPTAIEVIEDERGRSRLVLYYPRDKEVYTADKYHQKDVYEWIVRGPYAVQRKDYRSLMSLETAILGEPVFVIHGEQYRFRFQQPQVPSRILNPEILVTAPTPTPTAIPIIRRKKSVTPPKAKIETPAPKNEPFHPLNSDQQAIAISQGFAERAPNGDVVHTVAVDDESLSSIATWYTGSAGNEEKIASANGLKSGATLAKGTRVTIPMSLVTNFKAKR